MFNVKNQFTLIIIFVALAVLVQSMKVIPAGRTGVIFNLKGGIQKNYYGEGLHFIVPFLQNLIIFDTRVLTYSFSQANSEKDPKRLGDPIIAKTQDGQIVAIEVSIVTQMIKEKDGYGDWVYVDDVEELEEENKKLKEEIEKLQEQLKKTKQ